MTTRLFRYSLVLTAALALMTVSNLSLAGLELPPRNLKAARNAAEPLPPVPEPQNVVAAPNDAGVKLTWQHPDPAARFLVLRGTGAAPTEPPIATLPTGTRTYVDMGFNARATYQIIAVAADGRRGASALVSYQPPARPNAARPAPALLLPPPPSQAQGAAPPPPPPSNSNMRPPPPPPNATAQPGQPSPAVSPAKIFAVSGLIGKAGDGIIDGPIPFASPALQQRPNVKLLTNGRVVDINNKFAAPATPLLFKPFQLDEVFDMNTGKPLFAVNLSTGKLPLPHSPKVNITHTPSSDVAIMQRRGIRDFTVGRGGTFGLKPGAGSFTLTSLLTIPRPDGSLITIPVALFLKELNAYERGLNAHGTTLRDSVTGKISSTPREITVRKLAINHALIKQQRQNIEIKLIKNVNARPWGESEVAARHQAAVVKIPAAMLDSRNRLIGIPPVIPANNKIYLPNAASNPAAKTSEPLRQVNPAMVSSRCSLDLNQPEGGAPREKVSISLKNFDPNACVLHFEDSAGKHVDQPFVTQAGMVLTTQVPEGLAKGAGYISLRDKSKPTAFGTVPFYVGDACTIESVYPPIGMAGTELTLKVRRFKGCAVDFVDASTARTPVNYQFVVDVPGGKGIVAPPFITTSTIILPVPSFTLGKNRIESRLSANNATGQPVNSSFNFSIVRTVADPGGHAPPPDYFARGITPFERKYGWHQPYGDPNNIAVDIFADFSVSSKGQAEDNQVFFRGEGGANATLFNITSEIVGAHAEASVPTATSKENRLRAKFTLTAAGQTFYTWKKEKNKEDGTSDAAAESCQEDEKINGKCCIDKKPNGSCADDEGGLAVQVQFKYEKDFKLLNVDQAGEWNFTVGPVPLIARIGFHGEAGARVKFAMSPLQVIAQVTPYVNTSMYAECAVDLFLVEAGVGVDMILANLALDGAGQVYLDFGQMALVSELYVNFTYDILNGTLYLFVDTFGQRSKFNIFNINDMISQNTGVDLSVLKGNAYLLPPQRMTYPLLQGM